MNRTYCYWTVVDGDYCDLAAAMIYSARKAGVFVDFHVWSPVEIPGAVNHRIDRFDKTGCLFKLIYLRDAVQRLDYEHYIWADADTWFVRHPGDPLRHLKNSPMHIALESDLTSTENTRRDWWECDNLTFCALMRERGVRSASIFNVNGGLFIVRRSAVDALFRLAFDFWQFCKERGFTFNDEPLLAYAMQMLCGNPYQHQLKDSLDFWCSDWRGEFADRLPDGHAWWRHDYFTGGVMPANPAIVHAMRSKLALLAARTPPKGPEADREETIPANP